MAKQSDPPQRHAAGCNESRLPGDDKKVLLDYRLPTRLEEIETLANAVNEAVTDRDLAFAANLCLEELITNTITHGLNAATDRFIHVRISISNEWLEILLKDDAPRFDPFTQAPRPDVNLELTKRPVGGLGVHLVKTVMDEVRAYHDGTGNLFVLYKALRHPTP
jgi:serine/threonine-protein kinase RsbW